jgi:membrane protein
VVDRHEANSAEADRRGRRADRPSQLSRGWIDVAKRTRAEAKRDNVGLVAAGVAFYAFFSLFPALAALVALYGLVADPAQVESQMNAMSGVLPAAVLDIVRTQLGRVAATSSNTLGWGFALTLAVAIWSASKGTRGLVTALNIAYDEEETRGFLRRTGMVLLLTVGGIVGAIVALALVVGVPAFIGQLGLGTAGRVLAEVVRWLLLAVMIVAGLAVVYRFAPSRDEPRWRWVSVGSVLAAVLWLAGSVAFSLYVQYSSSYQSTFGSLGAVAILLMWFFLSAYVIVLGAELNAEAEHQTSADTTAGPKQPMGTRGAHVADTLGESPA